MEARHPKRNVARVVATDSDAAIPNHSPVASFAVLVRVLPCVRQRNGMQ